MAGIFNNWAMATYIKMVHSRPLFLYFRLFNTVVSKMFNINSAGDWT